MRSYQLDEVNQPERQSGTAPCLGYRACGPFSVRLLTECVIKLLSVSIWPTCSNSSSFFSVGNISALIFNVENQSI